MVAQDRSIRFEEGSYQEALNKAKKENKLLFVVVTLRGVGLARCWQTRFYQ